MEKYEHGGNVDENIIKYDFSANVNPLGLPQGVKEVLAQQMDSFCKYPDPKCQVLRAAIAHHEGVKTNQVACGNGASELLYKLLKIVRPKRVLIPVPAFVEYEKAVLQCGGQVLYYDMPEPFFLTEDILPVLEREAFDMLILCSPNNPTGDLICEELLRRIMELCHNKHIYLLLDACFMGFVDDSLSYSISPFHEKVVVLKAFTKLYGMAGLRLGYMLCGDEDLMEKLLNYGPCWNVSVPAQIAGVAALKDIEYVAETKRLVKQERMYLETELEKLGLRCYQSQANFILFHCPVPIMEGLRQAGIAIRSCENYRGLGKDYYRIAVRTHEENVVLIQALTELL